MYKVIIVDDELIVRERLKKLLERFEDDFALVKSYDNGYDLLLDIDNIDVDIVITDIKMPFIDGLSLIKELKREKPLIQCIIISGHDSFDYAKQAIELGVVGYISKPITYDELNNILNKTKEKLDFKFDIDFDIKNFKNQIKDSNKIITENDLRRLICYKNLSDNFYNKLIYDGIKINTKYITIAICDLDIQNDSVSYEKYEIDKLYIIQYIEKEFKDILNIYFFNIDYEINVLITFNNQEYSSIILTKFEQVLAKLKRDLNISLSIGLSEIVSLPYSFRKLYRHAKRCLEYRGILGENLVLSYSDLNNKNDNLIGKIDDNEFKQISYSILCDNEEEAFCIIKKILNKISSNEYKQSYQLILSNLLDTIIKSCVDLNKLYSNFYPHIEIIKMIYGAKSKDYLVKIFKNLLSEVIKINLISRKSGIDNSYEQIIKFIDNNYNISTLSLDDVANELAYSVSYISAILKQFNTSFTKYLTKVRMEKSRELIINTSKKMITIADEVGYKDPYYFSHCFKKYYGVSPIDYRK